jgi:hypothetical protein
MSEDLAHFGVKGMRWGHRKAKDISGPSGSSKPAAPPRKTRKEVRQINREGRAKFNEEKIHKILAASTKNGGKDVLVGLTTPDSVFPTIVTGREFVEYVSRGGGFDVRLTDIYATKQGKNYVINENANQQYKKVKR